MEPSEYINNRHTSENGNFKSFSSLCPPQTAPPVHLGQWLPHSWSNILESPCPSPCVLAHIESIRNQSMPTPIPLPPNRHLPCSSHAGLILAVPQTCQDHSQLRAFALACPSLCLECPPHIHPQGSPPWGLYWHVLPHETSLTTWPEVTPIAHPCLSLLCSSLALISI